MEHLHEGKVEKHDDGHVHQVVGYEDGGQEAFAFAPEFQYLSVGTMVLFLHLTQVDRREGEKGHL